MIEITVSNVAPNAIVNPPEIEPEILAAFLSTLPKDARQNSGPFPHQLDGWNRIAAGEELALIAGTAAGKTLTAAAPIFDALFRVQKIHRVLFLYPTIALMQDQREALGRLLSYYQEKGQAQTEEKEIGVIQGGMKSSQLLAALNKRVLLATPDAVYWFFRKNIKYNAFLIYGLLQANVIVVDEAHLFTGLMLKNAVALLDRLRWLKQEYLHRSLLVHYLTATGRSDLRALSPQSIERPGESKCGNVRLLIETQSPIWERGSVMAAQAQTMINEGHKRVLVVCNSARRAHQLFETLRDKRKSAPPPDLTARFREAFGLVQLGEAMSALEAIDSQVAEQVRCKVREKVVLRLKDMPGKVALLRAEYLNQLAADWLQEQERKLGRRLLNYVSQHPNNLSGEDMHATLKPETRSMLALNLRGCANFDDALALIERRLSEISEWLEKGWGEAESREGGIMLKGTDPAACGDLVERIPNSLGLDIAKLGRELGLYLSQEIELSAESLVNQNVLDFSLYAHRRVPVRRFVDWIASKDVRERFLQEVLPRLEIEHLAVGRLKDRDVLVICYSGSMARYAREGLIQLFGDAALKQPAILIATSAVEVGVDFAADALVTEECPASSFLQRFGRVGRRGGESKVVVLVNAPTESELALKIDGRQDVPRREFNQILSQLEQGFQERKSISASRYADAAQWMVSEQLGQVGRAYVEAHVDLDTRTLAEQLRAARIDPAYGLRGTLPGVTLADGVSKDPFYILGYLKDTSLAPADTPFELARSICFFNELIWDKPFRVVSVHIQNTLDHCRAIVLPDGTGWRIIRAAPEQASLISQFIQLRKFATSPIQIRRLLVKKNAPDWPSTALDCPNILLCYGDVYLRGQDKDDLGQVMGESRLIQTYNQSNLRLYDQWYLLVLGQTREQAKEILEKTGAAGYEGDIHYDFESEQQYENGQDASIAALTLIERQAGAIWEVWERLRRAEAGA